MSDPWDKPFDASVFDDSYETSRIIAAAEGMDIPSFPWNHPAVKFARWYIKKFGHGPKGSESWIDEGANYRADKGFAQSGETTPGTGSGLGDYVTDRNGSTTEGEVDTNEVDTNEVDTNEVDTNEVDTNGTSTIDEITVVDKFPENPTQGMQVIKDGIKYVWSVWGLGDGWSPVTDELSGGPPNQGGIEEIIATGTAPGGGGFDWSSISDWGGLASILSALGISLPGLGGGDDEELSFLEKLLEMFATKKGIDDYNKYQVPTDQMDAQSAIGKQWGLPDPDKMVMQGLGPNYLQDQKYVMNKGKATPAATHVGGLPLVEEKIEGGEQGGIMGLKSRGDITPAFLEPGEFVFTKKATDNVGAKRLYKLMQQAEQMGMR